MPPKPITRIQEAITACAGQYGMSLRPPQIYLLAKTVAQSLQTVTRSPMEVPAGVRPTAEELTLLRLIANGATTAHLAKVTHHNPSKIDIRLGGVCVRMGVATVTQAIVVCLIRGWIKPDDVRIPAGVPRGKSGPKRVNA